jgi:phage N-6-adenine-methyltransferase
MALSGFRARAHPQQVSRRWPTVIESVDDRATQRVDFDAFDQEFGPFTVDVAAAAHNTKCHRFYDRDQDGLAQDWSGEAVWCNPPYSDIAPWVRKAWDSWASTSVIVMLLPANRTEQLWWQTMVEPYRDRGMRSPLTTRFLPGRMRFLKPGDTEVQPNSRPPFGCVLLIWGNSQATARRLERRSHSLHLGPLVHEEGR